MLQSFFPQKHAQHCMDASMYIRISYYWYYKKRSFVHRVYYYIKTMPPQYVGRVALQPGQMLLMSSHMVHAGGRAEDGCAGLRAFWAVDSVEPIDATIYMLPILHGIDSNLSSSNL